jgi:hypothetical protein
MRGVFAALTLALAVAVVALAADARPLPHVTVIGDSVADAIPENQDALATIAQGVDVDLEVTPCRRLVGQGCPYQGVYPPSAVDLIKSMGTRLGANVVIAVGYNDFEDQYAQNIELTLAALHDAGVKHVWWLTLRAAHHSYLPMNDEIFAAAQKHPELSVIDWNLYSRSHPNWFQEDGLHLVGPGAVAMATLIHKRLVAEGVALKPVRVLTTSLPDAPRGKSYRAKLRAGDGAPPYRWSLLARAPRGIHLEPNGLIVGHPSAKPGRYVLNVRVMDTAGSFDSHPLVLRITP